MRSIFHLQHTLESHLYTRKNAEERQKNFPLRYTCLKVACVPGLQLAIFPLFLFRNVPQFFFLLPGSGRCICAGITDDSMKHHKICNSPMRTRDTNVAAETKHSRRLYVDMFSLICSHKFYLSENDDKIENRNLFSLVCMLVSVIYFGRANVGAKMFAEMGLNNNNKNEWLRLFNVPKHKILFLPDVINFHEKVDF